MTHRHSSTHRLSRRLAAAAAALAGLLVTLTGVGAAQATFPGVNGLVLFNRGGNLFTATATGGSIKQLTTTGGISGAKWSPDGKSIAYRVGSSIYTRTYPGGVTKTIATGTLSSPQWSPDGSKIAFLAELPDAPCGERAVFTVRSTGGAVPSVAWDPHEQNACPGYEPVYQLGTYLPDGRMLMTGCYWRAEDSNCWIQLNSMDGSDGVTLLMGIGCYLENYDDPYCTQTEHLSDARTAAGGKGIVFSGRGGYDAPTGTLPGSTPTPTSATPERVYTVDTAGTRLRTVTTATAGYSPVLSPDGKAVLFTQASGGSTNLMKAGTASSSVATLLIANASQADWRPVA